MTDRSTAPYEKIEISYGEDQYQIGDLYISGETSIGTVCLFHGGFWKMPYDKSQFDEIAKKLVRNKFAVWNLEYRRTGYKSGGYPGTFTDAVDGINKLEELQKKYNISLNPLIIAGHSAGGHLSLWLGGSGLKVIPDLLVGLAPVVNLRKNFESDDRRSFVRDLLGCTPSDDSDLYARTSPIEMLPLGIEQLIIHGDMDEVLPMEEVGEYVQKSREAGDKIDFLTIEEGTHMDFIDPESEAVNRFVDWIKAFSNRQKDQYNHRKG